MRTAIIGRCTTLPHQLRDRDDFAIRSIIVGEFYLQNRSRPSPRSDSQSGMTDTSVQSDSRDAKITVCTEMKNKTTNSTRETSLPSLVSVSWANQLQFSVPPCFTGRSKASGYDFDDSNVKLEVTDSNKYQLLQDSGRFIERRPDSGNMSNLNDKIQVLKLAPNLSEHQIDGPMYEAPMYCLSDGNLLVPMFCPGVLDEHGLSSEGMKMSSAETKDYVFPQTDVIQSQLSLHFQQQQQQQHQQQHPEFLQHWSANDSPTMAGSNSSYETFNADFSEADHQSNAIQHFQQQHQHHQHHHHHHHQQDSSSNPAKKKRRRVITTDQRRAANIRERRRMSHLNEAFDGLRKRLPTFAYEKKLSRIETLKLAVTYIRFMANLLETLDAGDKGIPGTGFHGDQKVHQVPHSNPFLPSAPGIHHSSHHHLSHYSVADKTILLSGNRGSMVTDDESLDDDDENGSILVGLQDN